MREWLVYTVLTLLCWGLYGFLPKLATRQLGSYSALFYYLAGALLVGAAGLLSWGQRPEYVWPGAMFAALTGAFGLLGGFFYLAAVRQGNLAVVVTTTALYPLITIMLGFAFLNEAISLRQGAGIILAIVAMVLMVG